MAAAARGVTAAAETEIESNSTHLDIWLSCNVDNVTL
jgi:hypothetical protein